MSPPPLRSALSLGLRAAAREGWLLPVGLVVAALRAVATVPAFAVAAAVLAESARRASWLRPHSPLAPLEGVAAVATSPRFLALVGGTWLAGAVLSGLLRVVFLAGAFPTLGARSAGVDSTRRFAPGVAWGLPRQVATWLLGGLAELGATGYLIAVAVAAGRLAASPRDGTAPALLAATGAAAFTVGFAGLLASRILGDVAAARTAILGEGPAAAFAGATRRFLSRPGAFMLGGAAVGLAGLAAWSALQPAAGIVAVVRQRMDGAIALGPELMLALLAALGAAAVDLAWLATVGALACARAPASAPGREGRRLSA